MAEDKKTTEMDTETPSAPQETQSVMSRVSNLALVSSAFDAVSSAYSSTKENIPVLRGVMDAAESGVRTLSTAASSGTKPLLNKLEPQIAMVNEYAFKGLDKMEENLPVLNQPAVKDRSSDVIMAEDGQQTEMDTETHSALQETQSVMSRVSNLALVSSACDAVSSAYSSTKENIPVLKGVMDAAESGVRTLSTAASSGTKPLLNKLEPQIAMVNEYALKGLDKMEENLPVLNQPADKLVSETVGKVYQCVSGAKDTMMGVMMGGVEMTRSALSGGINTVMGSRVGQMVSSSVGLAVNHSGNDVEQKLPLTETELAAVAEPLPKDELRTSLSSEGGASESPAPSYFVRLGKLSTQVQERALELSLVKASSARDATHRAVTQITSTLDLLENLRGTNALVGAPEQLLKRWREWRQEGQDTNGAESTEVDGGEEGKENGEQLEWRALSMVRSLSEQLRVACSGVVSSVQGLPSTVQEQLQNARHSAEELHSSLRKTNTVTPMLLQQSRNQLTQVRQSLDGVVEYLLNNTPLNWLVGPFAPQLTEKRPSAE